MIAGVAAGLSACDRSPEATNANPEAAVTSHLDADEVAEGAPVLIRGAASDPDGSPADLQTTWYLNSNEICGLSAPATDGSTECSIIFSEAGEIVTLAVIDAEGAVAKAELALTVIENEDPGALIVQPTTTEILRSDLPTLFSGIVTDAEEPVGDLQVTWTSSLDGALQVDRTVNADGEFSGSTLLSEGDHLISLTVTDSIGQTGQDLQQITVYGPNHPPTCSVAALGSDSAVPVGSPVSLTATVDDEDTGPEALVLSWSSDLDGELGGSFANSDGEVTWTHSNLSVGQHEILLTVVDAWGEVCSDSVPVTLGTPPSLTLVSPVSGTVFNEGETITFAGVLTDPEESSESLQVSWSSSQDGVFSTDGASDVGELTTSTTLSGGQHIVVVTATDGDGMEHTATVSLSVNQAPSPPDIAIGPTDAATGQDLTVLMTTASIDPDGDALTYAYLWEQDGVTSDASTSATLPAEATAKGEVWTVRVKASDGALESGISAASLTIANTPPELIDASLSPSTLTSADAVTCVPGEVEDADGDTAFTYSYSWTVNGVDAAVSSSELGNSRFVRSDLIACAVTVDDGDAGNTVTTSSSSVGNALPTITEVSLTPEEPRTDDKVTAISPTEDGDGDLVTLAYAWEVNGVDIGVAKKSLGPENFSAGDTLTVYVTPIDAYDSGIAVSASTTAINTPPEAPVVEVVQLPDEPAEPYQDDGDLQCRIVAEAPDVDGDTPDYSFRWTYADSSWTGSTTSTDRTGDTIADAELRAGEWSCTATASDGETGGDDTASVSVRHYPIDLLTDPSVSFEGQTGDSAFGLSTVKNQLGADDLLVGAAGNVYLAGAGVLGGSSSLASSEQFLAVGGALGFTAGEFGTDGIDDLVFADADTYGSVYIVMSESTPAWTTDTVDAADLILSGSSTVVANGEIASVPDVDGDGLDELLVGSAGGGYVLMGASLSAASSLEDYDFEAPAGTAVGDLNGDGLPEFAYGSPADSSAGRQAGAVFIFDGGIWASPGELPDEDPDYSLLGELPAHRAGGLVAGAGDVTGDGTGDLLVGRADGAEVVPVGAAVGALANYVFAGTELLAGTPQSLAIATVRIYQDAAPWVSSADTVGDLDGDARSDLVINNYLFLGSQFSAGSVYDITDAAISFEFCSTCASASGDWNGDGARDFAANSSINLDATFSEGVVGLFFGGEKW